MRAILITLLWLCFQSEALAAGLAEDLIKQGALDLVAAARGKNS